MSLDLAKLRLLQRQAGQTEGSSAPAAASPPAPMAQAATPASSAAASAGRRHAADAQRIPRADAGAPAVEERRLGGLRSALGTSTPRPHPSPQRTSVSVAATDIPFLDDAQRRSPATDSEQLRRLIALRERKPGTDTAVAVVAAPSAFAVGNAPGQTAAGPAAVGDQAPAPARAARTDIDALRRLIALRERKPLPAVADAGPPAFDVAPSAAGAPPDLLPRRSLDRSLPGEEIAPGLYFQQAHLPLPLPASALSLGFAKRADETVEPQRLLFFDTETTGLAGGTGTRAFMIGAADWHRDPLHGDGLRIRQLTIASLAAEPAMLREFAGWLSPDTVLSSYNGRCYDAPLLNTRYRLARLPNPLSGLDHVDLLFPTRRLYRGVWENCKLATIERELLRILREDDLPGAQAPAAWLQYLRGGSAALLRRVIAHNHQDVATLAQLLPRLVQAHAELAAAE
ncbi:ribonuclease H-like domain-containing protein [Lysobacter firmicutimachus]|uniref:ribonuclease H-like domain-containing protein n=1 Tax=Lysobacter firmicutimachus TaxID=1792846 RepID=UPI003CE4C7EB